MPNQYYVQIHIANQGTPAHHPTDGTTGPSAFGHIWYEIHQAPNDVGESYGFGPQEEGDPFGQGKTNFDDTSNYQLGPNDYSSPLIHITQEQYAILQDFGEHPKNYDFNLQYNGVSNSCVDFTWEALAQAGLTPAAPDGSHFQGNPIPLANRDNVEEFVKYRSDLDNGLPASFNPKTFDYSDGPVNGQEVIGNIASYFGVTDAVIGQSFLDKITHQDLTTEQLNSFTDILIGQISSLIVPHDNPSVPDLLTASSDGSDNVMVGRDGQQNTFYIPSFNADFVIIDKDGTGNIVIGNGSQSIPLTGNAIPKKDAFGNIIPDHWSLNGYDLIREDNNLIIILAGANAGDTPKITINNFPFDSGTVNFGLTLGKAKTGEFDAVELVRQEIYSNIFATKDRNGRFFAVTLSAAGLHITNYDANGNSLGSQDICPHHVNYIPLIWSDADSSKFINGAWVLENHQLIMPFQAFSGEAGSMLFSLGIARVDVDSGKVVTSKIVKELREGSDVAINFNNAGLSTYGNDYALHFDVRSTIDSARRNEVVRIDKRSFAQIGETEIYYGPFPEYCNNGLVPGLDCPSAAGGFSRPLNQAQEISLANGGKAFLRPLVEDIDLLMFLPKLRDMLPAEIPNSKSLPAGTTQSAADILQGIITFQDAVNAATATELQITPIPNQKLVINGLDNGGFVDISPFALTQQQIADRTFEVNASEFSALDLLNGAFTPARRKRDLDFGKIDSSIKIDPAIFAGFEIDEDEMKEIARSRRGADDDDYEEPSQDVVEEALRESPEVFTVLNLGKGQLLIFPGISKEEFLNRTSEFLAGALPNQIPATTQEFNASFSTTAFTGNGTFPTGIPGNFTPQINGTNTSNNPLAVGSPGFVGLLVVAGIATGAVMGAIFSQTFRDKIRTVGNFLDPRNWTRSRNTNQQEEPTLAEIITHRDQVAAPLAADKTTYNEAFEEEEFHLANDQIADETATQSSERAPSPSASLREEDDVVMGVVENKSLERN